MICKIQQRLTGLLAVLFISPIFVSCNNDDDAMKLRSDHNDGKLANLSNFFYAKPLPVVETYTVKTETVKENYKTTSLITAAKDIELFLLAGERVLEVKKKAGDKVKKNNVIALLSQPDLKLNEKQAIIAFQDAKRRHEDDKVLYAQNHIPKDAFEKTKLELQKANLDLQSIREKIKNLEVKAPFNGMLARNDLQEGAFVKSYQARAPIRLVQLSRLKGEVELPTAYVGRIKRKTPLEVFSRGKSAKAEIDRLEPVINPITGTFKAYYTIKNRHRHLIPGEKVEIRIEMGKAKDRILLPEDTIVYEGNQTFVYLIQKPNLSEIQEDIQELAERLQQLPEGQTIQLPEQTKSLPSSALAKGSEESPTNVRLDRNMTPEQLTTNQSLHDFLKAQPRIRKVAVEVEQLPNGFYALIDQLSLPKANSTFSKSKTPYLEQGSEIAKMGLRQMSDGTKVQILKGF